MVHIIPHKWMGFSRLLPPTLSDCVCGSANIAPKGVPGMFEAIPKNLEERITDLFKLERCCDHLFVKQEIWQSGS